MMNIEFSDFSFWSLFKAFFNVFGRISRAKYWLYSFLILLYLAGVFSLGFVFKDVIFSLDLNFYILIPLTLLFLIGLVASHNTTVRRLHDLNQTGLWAFFLYLPIYAPGIFFLPNFSSQDITPLFQSVLTGNIDTLLEPNNFIVLTLLAFICALYIIYVFAFIIELYTFKGSVGSNRYGDDPLEPVYEDEAEYEDEYV
ncbi:MAG: DUF805 domain-containing protein [Pseudomonadota bacterium]